MKATLTNFRQPPRKVRLLADHLRGKSVEVALLELGFLGRKSSLPIRKLLMSAIANAETNFAKTKNTLYIKTLRIDKGIVMKRSLPRARGRATPLRHRTSHILIELGDRAEALPAPKVETETKKVVKPKKTAKATTKKTAKAKK